MELRVNFIRTILPNDKSSVKTCPKTLVCICDNRINTVAKLSVSKRNSRLRRKKIVSPPYISIASSISIVFLVELMVFNVVLYMNHLALSNNGERRKKAAKTFDSRDRYELA